MPKKINFIQITLLFIMFSLTYGCQSHTSAIEKNLSPAEYFQLARDATVEGNYRLALAYYESFIDQYNSNNHQNEIHRLLWADYEIAFLYHKMDNDKKAIDLLNKLIFVFLSKLKNSLIKSMPLEKIKFLCFTFFSNS